MNKANNKLLVIETDVNFHAEVRKRAAMRGISMKAWVIRAIAERIKKENQYGESDDI